MLSGRARLDAAGNAGHTDLARQTSDAFDELRTSLRALEGDFNALVKLMVFYVQQEILDENTRRQLIAIQRDADSAVVLTMVPLRFLGSPGLKVEVDAYAKCEANASASSRDTLMTDGAAHPTDRFCQGLRCGQSVFVGGRPPSGHERSLTQPPGLVEQNARALSSVANILDQLGTSADDIVKFNTWRAPPPTVQAYTDAARDRFSFFCGAAPAVTGITVPNLQATGDLIRMDAWAMLPAAAERSRLMPMDHWDWKLKTGYSHGVRCGDLLFVGGQAALDEHGDVVRPDVTAAQTHITMIYIGRILREGGATFDDVIKLNAYYRGTDSVAGLTENLKVRNSYFAAPGPIATAVPVDNLAYPRMEIEIVARCRAGQDR